MASSTTQKHLDLAHFHALNPSITRLRIEGGELLSTQAKTLETDDCTQAELDAAVASYTHDPDWKPKQEERDWRTLLQGEIDYISGQLSTWPTNANTNAEALQRVNFLLSATKRLARNQERILAYIRDQVMDTGA